MWSIKSFKMAFLLLFQYDLTLINISNLIKTLSHFLPKVYMFVFYMPGGSESFGKNNFNHIECVSGLPYDLAGF